MKGALGRAINKARLTVFIGPSLRDQDLISTTPAGGEASAGRRLVLTAHLEEDARLTDV
jgi:hypothetical protein